MSGASGERLDHYLVRTGHAASRRDARAMVERGAVMLNGRRGIKGALVRAGDHVDVEASAHRVAIEPDPEASLEVLFADPSLLVINKPGAMPCHPLRPGQRGSVMNAVVARYPECSELGDKPVEGGLIHRLDNGTSGALMIARSAEALTMLRAALRAGAVRRKYFALVSGNLKIALRRDAPIAHHPKNPRKMVIADAAERIRLGARRAHTRIDPMRRVGNFTLVAVTPSSGVRHQIRVHLAGAGYPIVGDELYGGPNAALGAGRFALHLSEIELETPASGSVKVVAPLPDDFAKLI